MALYLAAKASCSSPKDCVCVDNVDNISRVSTSYIGNATVLFSEDVDFTYFFRKISVITSF